MKYEQMIDEVGIELKSKELFRFACCDCGLVHDMVIVGGRKGKPIGFAVRRNKRATTMRRKAK